VSERDRTTHATIQCSRTVVRRQNGLDQLFENGPNLYPAADNLRLAEYLGDYERHVRRLVAEQRIPYLKVGPTPTFRSR
jgi:hypothetical protein